ncbi:hypothetical protein [Salicibibacter cibarius]
MKRNKKKKVNNAAMAFGIDKHELKKWKARAKAGEISVITHYWVDDRFPDCDSVTKVACGDYPKLVQWGKAYGLKEKWIHERGELSHFDLFGNHQRRVLLAEGLYDQWKRFRNDAE